MKIKAERHLERAAIAAYSRGDTWATFWPAVAEQARQAEPYHRGRYRRLVNRLLALVASGDTDGMEPAGEPWLLDDVPSVLIISDTATAARINWQAAGIVEAST